MFSFFLLNFWDETDRVSPKINRFQAKNLTINPYKSKEAYNILK